MTKPNAAVAAQHAAVAAARALLREQFAPTPMARLSKAEALQALRAGEMPPERPAPAAPVPTQAQLQDVQDDLRRATYARDLAALAGIARELDALKGAS